MLDFSKPIEVVPKIWWVGYVIPNDPFQCHVYLIENGDESILIDPGSMITFPVTLEKIVQITSLRNIKYIIMHHQDPDIVGCYATLESIMPYREDRRIVTHWRTWMLLKHYQWKTPFYLVDKEEWKLKAGEKEFEFIFTPYAHFAGAICTYDRENKIVFSSDLFGGLTEKFKFYADKNYLEEAKLFHKHYMPSKEILNYAMKKIEDKNPKMILPQHGSIIKGDLVKYMISGLKNLDCGLYLMDDYIDDIKILNEVDEIFKSFIQAVIINEPFDKIIEKIYHFLNTKISLKAIRVATNKFSFTYDKIKKSDKEIEADFKIDLNFEGKNLGNMMFEFKQPLNKKEKMFLDVFVKKLSLPLGGSLYRYLLLKEYEEKEKELYEKAVKDPLTRLYNRNFFVEFLEKKIEEAKRYKFSLSVAMIDIDFFKKVNDTYGHLTGDCILKEIAYILSNSFRDNDIIARYGGEEFIIVMPFSTLKEVCKRLEFLREKIKNSTLCNDKKITVSIGVTQYSENDNIESFIERADVNLYEAKKSGRNRVICR